MSGYITFQRIDIDGEQVLDHARDEYLFMYVGMIQGNFLQALTMQLFRIRARSIKLESIDILSASTGKYVVQCYYYGEVKSGH